MLQERYNDKSKLVTDASELVLNNDAEVMIYREDKWQDEVVVWLEGQEDQFEELKPFIIFAARNLCKMDYIAQKYEYDRDSRFAEHFVVAYICLDPPDRIKLTYYGVTENTEFDVGFQYINGGFILKSFGMVKDIPPDAAFG